MRAIIPAQEGCAVHVKRSQRGVQLVLFTPLAQLAVELTPEMAERLAAQVCVAAARDGGAA